MYAPRFPFDLYLVVNYIKFLVHFGPMFLDAIEKNKVPSYSASGSIDHFDRASYNSASWYLCVVFPLV